MEFRTQIAFGKEVLIIGHERGNSNSPSEWLKAGRWKISMQALDAYLTECLKEKSYGISVNRFVFCFEIADFKLWGNSFRRTADFTSYRPKAKEVWSVGQLSWTEMKDLQAREQLRSLRIAIQSAIRRISTKSRKPRDFACETFASDVDAFLAQVAEKVLIARPAT